MIYLVVFLCCNYVFIYDILYLTISFRWQLSLHLQLRYTVLLLSWCFIQDFGIVLLHQIFHIGGATVAKFDCIFVKDVTEFVMLLEMLFDKL